MYNQKDHCDKRSINTQNVLITIPSNDNLIHKIKFIFIPLNHTWTISPLFLLDKGYNVHCISHILIEHGKIIQISIAAQRETGNFINLFTLKLPQLKNPSP